MSYSSNLSIKGDVYVYIASDYFPGDNFGLHPFSQIRTEIYLPSRPQPIVGEWTFTHKDPTIPVLLRHTRASGLGLLSALQSALAIGLQGTWHIMVDNSLLLELASPDAAISQLPTPLYELLLDIDILLGSTSLSFDLVDIDTTNPYMQTCKAKVREVINQVQEATRC